MYLCLNKLMQNPLAENFAKLSDLLKRSQGVILATHGDPDGDAIGAVYALSHALAHMGKPHCLYLPDGVPEDLAFLQNAAMVHATHEALSGDVVIAVDYGDFPRTRLHDYAPAGPLRIVTIDHHPPSDHRGEVVIVDTAASSTCELVYQFCIAADILITKPLATCLLAGIVFDTGGLQHSNTSSRALDIASDLVRHGARMHKVSGILHGEYDKPSLRVIASALANMQYDKELDMSYAVVRHEELVQAGEDIDLSPITHLLGTSVEQRFAVFFKEAEPGKFRVSLRSDVGKNVDVSVIAKQFGGGGHTLASGCKIEGEFPNVLARLREAAKAVVA